MKTFVQLFFICSVINLTMAQESFRPSEIEKNTIYTEVFGQGFCWSLNYDRLIKTENRWMNSITAGVVYVPGNIQFGDGTYFGIPGSYNWLLGKKSHHLELGLGFTSMLVLPYYTNEGYSFYAYAAPKIAYRFQRQQGGLFAKATITTLIDVFHVNSTLIGQNGNSRSFSSMSDVLDLGYPVFPWPGVSLGYTFK